MEFIELEEDLREEMVLYIRKIEQEKLRKIRMIMNHNQSYSNQYNKSNNDHCHLSQRNPVLISQFSDEASSGSFIPKTAPPTQQTQGPNENYHVFKRNPVLISQFSDEASSGSFIPKTAPPTQQTQGPNENYHVFKRNPVLISQFSDEASSGSFIPKTAPPTQQTQGPNENYHLSQRNPVLISQFSDEASSGSFIPKTAPPTQQTQGPNENYHLSQRNPVLISQFTDEASSGSFIPKTRALKEQSRQEQNRQNKELYRGRIKKIPDMSFLLLNAHEEHYLGKMNEKCSSCGALFFKDESPNKKGSRFLCCDFGNITSNIMSNYPIQLRNLLEEDNERSEDFRKRLRLYNNSLAMASLNVKHPSIPGYGPLNFVIQGQVYRKYGPLNVENNSNNDRTRQFAQYYVLDPDAAAAERLKNYPLRPDIIIMLSSLIMRMNRLAQSYRMMGDVMKEEKERALKEGKPVPNVRMVFEEVTANALRNYNNPTCNEIAIVYVSDENGDLPPPRELTIFDNYGGLRNISELNPLADPLIYPIFFPRGEEGWNFRNMGKKNKKVTQRQFYSYFLYERPGVFNQFLHGRRLFQQFAVDAYIKIESNRLNFHITRQKDYRVATETQLLEHMSNNDITSNDHLVGNKIILPNSYVGSPRYMYQSYHDAMAIVAQFGKPDLFLTVTCNPKWVEITENLKPMQSASDRPDIVARVFDMKMKAIIYDLTERAIFGHVTAYIAIKEWQKRGLPHFHMLIFFHHSQKIKTSERVDALIKAELPCSETNPILYSNVTTHMIHRQCVSLGNHNALCAKKLGTIPVCSKHFPKSYSDQTILNDSSFPIYKRRNNKDSLNNNGEKIDNAYVVPYNPYLLLKYNSHINLEVCSMTRAVKYLFKYVYKGQPKARVGIEQENEIKTFVDGRYMSAPEAIHSLLCHKLEFRSHSVFSLHIHLPNEKFVRFQVGSEDEALDKLRNSTLEAWFQLNELTNPYHDLAKDIFYKDIPQYFLFEKGVFVPRKNKSKTIGRLHYVPPYQEERFALRTLLLHRKAITSFDNMKTVDGTFFETYHEAALYLQLLKPDNFIKTAILEAVELLMPSQLRSMYVMLIAFETLTNPSFIWNEFQYSMSEDFVRKGFSLEVAAAKAYFEICDSLQNFNIDFTSYVSSPPIPRNATLHVIENLDECKQYGDNLVKTLNPEQKYAFDRVMDSFLQSSNKLYFLDGPGGSGKTYLYNALYYTLKAQKKNIICVAWTGIAATLLPNGRTCHNIFKLPLQLDKATFLLNPNSIAANFLRQCDVIIWDEISMVPLRAFDLVDLTLKEVCSSSLPFGGKVVVCGGDFRQTLPIVGRNLNVCQNTVLNSSSWKFFTNLSLSKNMRVDSHIEWANFLLKLGEGKLQRQNSESIQLPPSMFSDDLVENVYGNKLCSDNFEYTSSRVILAPKNVNVDEINEDVLKRISGNEIISYSFDEVLNPEQHLSDQISLEFLNSLNPVGFPAHKLKLKKGATVMLLRNLDIANGLTNGTRLIVVSIRRSILKAKVISGPKRGEFVIIPKITLICDKELAIQFKRTQFPIKLAFAMSINKSQGQTFDSIGIFLKSPVFAHGQLYVALSRCRDPSKIRIFSERLEISNIVEKDLLAQL